MFIIVQLKFKSGDVLKNVAPLSEDYIVEQIHFHWGHQSDNTNGSEHALEGRFYPLEVWEKILSALGYFYLDFFSSCT